ncbi:hypothetical protein ZWY2020_047559 [Hordeum vulgare]|nr:hypothetical protein ZWY2020_047559 [Hordeum vulgare]
MAPVSDTSMPGSFAAPLAVRSFSDLDKRSKVSTDATQRPEGRKICGEPAGEQRVGRVFPLEGGMMQERRGRKRGKRESSPAPGNQTRLVTTAAAILHCARAIYHLT